MKHLKLFESFSVTEEQVQEWLNKNCDSAWFDKELQDKVYDYISDEEAEDYDGDVIEAYKNLSTGGAVEYDLLSEMNEMVCDALSIPKQYAYDEKIEKRTVSNICHDHLMDNCKWYDKFVFNRKSTEPYKSYFDRAFGTDWDSDDIKL
jgi:hypothetical protein